MNTACLNCQSNFEITEEDLKFYDKISPVINGEKFAIPTPALCPLCRMKRRLAYRNDRSLYKTKSSLSGKDIISMYNPENAFTIYDQKEWWGQTWDAKEYGREFDFNRSFFDQFAEFKKIVPRFNVFNLDTENCDFVNYAPHCKNCYLIFGSWFNQDCLYGQTLNECKDCVDNLFLDKSELCYENIDGNSNYSSFFCQNCSSIIDCYFCYDCQNTKNCIGCYNLRNKEYYIANKPATKEEFERLKKELSSYQKLINSKNYFQKIIREQALHKAYTGTNNENVSGDFIFNCKNVRFCFSAYRSQDTAYSSRMFEQKDSYDFEGGGKGELLYENMSNDFSYLAIGCTTCEHLENCFYCDLCFNCQNCFGCIGLQKAQYCLFNKQYSKEEYENLLPKLIKKMQKDQEWGEFLPIKDSPFSYNETMAEDYFPLTKEETIKKGYKWQDEQPFVGTRHGAFLQSGASAQSVNIPDNIQDVTDQILDQVLICEISGKPYKIIKKELDFYKNFNLPIPRRHPDQRYKDRLALRNPRQLWNRNCFKCQISIETAYSPERPEKVYCEACYLKEVY